MGFKTGIVGLPNVGKSTLFNALTRTAAAQAANYPFCTIEPNTGEVAVPDRRLEDIAKISRSQKTVPATMTFVDIAGLVKGASQGDGLGNQFLASIREVDAIAHVVRCFENDDVAHVQGKINPTGDIGIIETELMLADMESIEKRIERLARKVRGGDRDSALMDDLLRRAFRSLDKGLPARLAEVEESEMEAWKGIQLITAKPVLYVSNVEESSASDGNAHSEAVEKLARENDAAHVVISAAIEEEIAQLENDEAIEYLREIGCERSGLERLIQHGYELLGLRTFFTSGPKESRAWTISNGTQAQDAAGVVHTDFQRGFIRAETISYRDFVEFGGEKRAKESGKVRSEGKGYVVQEGDVMRILFNV